MAKYNKIVGRKIKRKDDGVVFNVHHRVEARRANSGRLTKWRKAYYLIEDTQKIGQQERIDTYYEIHQYYEFV